MSNHERIEASKEKNMFRDTALRFLGYANEVGESFRYQLPRMVRPSYIVAFSYVGADAFYCAYRHSEKDPAITSGNNIERVHAAVVGFDALVWQTFASVLLPGGAINTIVKASRLAVSRTPIILPHLVSKWFPTCAGLLSIPFIVTPIDEFVDFTMNKTARSYLYEYRP
jgi:fission process protein 1